MATKERTCEESVKQIVLTEEDIPGAKLPRGNAEECTVPQLRRWLLCRGVKISGKKAELVKRFVCTMLFYQILVHMILFTSLA